MRKTALVTGAGHGIGFALAEGLARRGYDLFLVALHRDDLDKISASLSLKYQVECHAMDIDLTQPGACQSVFETFARTKGDLCILVNNAGMGSTAPFLSLAPSFYEKQILLNDMVPVVLTRLFLPELMQRSKAYILNVSSLGSHIEVPDKSVYLASKAFMDSFSGSLRLSLSGSNVHVTVVSPGPVNTNDRVRGTNARLKGLSARMILEPEEVAEQALAAMFENRSLIIPGRLNRLLYQLQNMLPSKWRSKLVSDRMRN